MIYYWNAPSEKAKGKRKAAPVKATPVKAAPAAAKSSATPTKKSPTTRRRVVEEVAESPMFGIQGEFQPILKMKVLFL
ncbi:hypothetical protein NLG97_g2511 [Lecanicillium saksenae]|uniref:Uncharacterized protein n=1 Tax=Lecanicillium saksenae TaxID=468837 RepID=A0ACC1R4S8_9HYPO|nr:hypothetical protein NLG97_g2511 [Lecanicillium saksenae]